MNVGVAAALVLRERLLVRLPLRLERLHCGAGVLGEVRQQPVRLLVPL